MSYTTKYSFIYTDIFGIASAVNLKLKDYAGGVTNLDHGSINYEFGRDRGTGVVRSSSASIGLWSLSQGQFSEFRGITDRQWIVEHIKGGTTYWVGWLTPEIFSEPFKHSVPYRIELAAVDGLGDLPNRDYTDTNGSVLVGREKLRTIISRCLNGAQLGLNLVFSCAIHPTGVSGDIFDLLTYSNSAYISTDGKPLKCSDVLERFSPLGITIKQSKGKWYILRTADMTATMNVYEYASDGTFVSNYYLNVNHTIDDTADSVGGGGGVGYSSKNFPIDQSGIMTNTAAYKEKEIHIDYGLKPSMLLNYNFQNGMAGWSEYPAGYTSIVTTPTEKYCLLDYHKLHSIPASILQGFAVKATLDDFNLAFKVGAFGWVLSIGQHDPVQLDYKIQITLVSGATVWYLNKKTGWTNTACFITDTIQSSTNIYAPIWNDIQIIASGIPIDGWMSILMYNDPVLSFPPNGSSYNYGVGYTEVKISQMGVDYLGANDLKCVNNPDYNNIPSKENIYFSDAPNVENAKLLYQNFIGDSTGMPTTVWQRTGMTPACPLAELYLREEVSLHRNPQRRLSITVLGVFDWYGTVSDKAGHIYELISATLNERNQTWDMELNEILNFQDGFVVTPVSSSNTPTATSGSGGSQTSSAGIQTADNVKTSRQNFDNILTTNEDTVQKALDKLDDHRHSKIYRPDLITEAVATDAAGLTEVKGTLKVASIENNAGSLLGVDANNNLTNAPTLVNFILAYNTSKVFSNPYELISKEYVDAIAAGVVPKLPVDAATTANITLSGTQTIDGYAVTAGMRVLVKNQTTIANNGVYIVAAGAWSRASDCNTWANLYKAYYIILNGTANKGSSYTSTVPSTGTLGTTDVTFGLFNMPGSDVPGAAIAKVGNVISVVYDGTTIILNGNTLQVAPNVFAAYSHAHSGVYEPAFGTPPGDGYIPIFTGGVRTWVLASTLVASGNARTVSFTNVTSVTINHNWGVKPNVEVVDATGSTFIPLSIDRPNLNTVIVTFSQASSGEVLLTYGAGTGGGGGGSSVTAIAYAYFIS